MTDALKTGFFWHEKCFWHGAGNYAFLLPVGGLVEPTSTGFLPEAPETKRRMKNLIEVTGLLTELDSQSPDRLASIDELALVHPKAIWRILRLYRMTRVVFLACARLLGQAVSRLPASLPDWS